MFQQGEIGSIGGQVALAEDPGDFPRLPVDDARQDQVEAAAGVHLLPQLAGVNPAPTPVKDVPGQGEVAESGAVGLLEDPAGQREALPVACSASALATCLRRGTVRWLLSV